MPYKYINNSASNMYDHNQVLSINTIMSISPIHSFIKEMLQCRERVKVPTIPGASAIRIDMVIQYWEVFPSQTHTSPVGAARSPFVLLRKHGLMQTRTPTRNGSQVTQVTTNPQDDARDSRRRWASKVGLAHGLLLLTH